MNRDVMYLCMLLLTPLRLGVLGRRAQRLAVPRAGEAVSVRVQGAPSKLKCARDVCYTCCSDRHGIKQFIW